MDRFEALIAVHGPALGRLAGAYTRGAAERDDLLQEILVAVWRALPKFRGECSERTFVFRIAHNRALSYLAQRRPPTVAADEDLALEDGRPDPEQALLAEQQQRQLVQAIRSLPVGFAQVITLALEGLSYAEIGDVLGITESNVGARLTRARQMLRHRMGNGHAA